MAEDRNMAREDKMAEESGRTAKNSAQENNPVKKKGTRPEESGSAAEGKAPAKKKKIIIVTGNPRGGKQGGQRGAYSSGSGSYSSGGGKSRERGSGSGAATAVPRDPAARETAAGTAAAGWKPRMYIVRSSLLSFPDRWKWISIRNPRSPGLRPRQSRLKSL